MEKTAMQQLSERLDKIIKYYEEEYGPPSSYHFRMLKTLVDSQYLNEEKRMILKAFNQGFREGESETMVASKKDVSEFDDAINYYKETYKAKRKYCECGKFIDSIDIEHGMCHNCKKNISE